MKLIKTDFNRTLMIGSMPAKYVLIGGYNVENNLLRVSVPAACILGGLND